MKIRLKEIPQDGRSYEFDRKSGELDEALSDLIGDREYAVDLFIKPIGNAYEMRGTLKTTVGEICSKCGYDFEEPIDKKVHEILFEDQEDYRRSHSVHGNNSVDFTAQAPSMTPYRNEVFDAGDYVHEAVALAEEFYPVCGPDGKCKHEDEVNEIRRKLEEEMARAEEAMHVNPAFSVLKGLELKN